MAILKEKEGELNVAYTSSSELLEIDKELAEILKKQLAKVKVFGIGGGGGNTLSRMKEIGIKGCEMIAVNTDAQDLLYTNADHKILIGRELTHGLGAGSNPRVGEEAIKENEQDIKKKLTSTDMVFITCGLGGGCLRGSSLVYTNPEGPVRIDSIQQGSEVLSFDNGKLVKRKVLAAMKTGIKKVLQVRTKNHTLHASFDHPFLKVVPTRLDKEGKFYDFDLKWAPAESLKKDDLVLTLRQVDGNKEVPKIEGLNIDESFCRLFGFLLGNGWITNNKDSWKFCFSPSKDKEINERYIGLIKEIFSLEMKRGNNWYYANSKKVYETLEKLGFKKNAKEKEIPKWIFKLPSSYIKTFILGLADVDSYYSKQIKKNRKEKNEIRFEIASEKLIKQLKVLCDYIGLRTSNVDSRTRKIRVPSTKKEERFTFWSLRIYESHQLDESLDSVRIRKGIGMLYKSHRRMKKHQPELFNNFSFERIQSVTEIGDEEVYDITVDGSHNFIAEGFVVHNTGTGAAPIIAELAKKAGALVVGVVTLPFTMEGKKRIENALYGLERMESSVDTLIVIPNDKLLELAPELPLQTAFKVADEILTNAVKGITELVTKSGLVNLDFADVKAVMTNGGVSLIGLGESDSQHRAVEAVEKAITNPLLNVDISNASGALINIIGGPDLTLEEAKIIVSTVGEKLSPEAKMIWGAQISEDLEKSLRVMLIVTGVKSSQIIGSAGQTIQAKKQEDMKSELGIEFLE